MASILITHKVKDFAEWKKFFDSKIDFRKSNGELSTQIFRDANDPNKLTVINKWNSMEHALKFAQSPELKASMEAAGVLGTPEIHFLNEV